MTYDERMFIQKARNLRRKVIDQLRDWENDDKIPIQPIIELKYSYFLRELFNYKGGGALAIYTIAEANELLPKLQALVGPNGYAIYKAMLEKQNVSVQP